MKQKVPVPLRFITYLSPSLPLGLFELLARRIGDALGAPVALVEDRARSGPSREDDPFSRGEADFGFLCAPSFTALGPDGAGAIVRVAEPVFDDARAGGRPVYYAEIVVARSSRAACFDDLEGATFCFNDASSLSGYHCVRERLVAMGRASFFERERASGSHLASMRSVIAGEADVAAIDSNVLAIARRAAPHLDGGLRVLESWGPYPIQPVVARATLDAERRGAAARALRAMHDDPTWSTALEAFLVTRFV